MNISINSKNLSVDLTKKEILIINVIIDQIDFISLKKIISKDVTEDELIELLKSLYAKKVVNIDNPSLLNIESFSPSESKSLTYLYSNANISEQIENLYNKIKNKDNYYSILGVSPRASLRDIKHSYYKLSRKYHPDVIKRYDLPKDIKEEVGFLIIELSNIFNILKSTTKRNSYDQTLDIFKKKFVTMKRANPNKENLEKGKEYLILAENEYHNGDLKKALKLIKLSLSYNNLSKKALKMKEDFENIVNRDSIVKKIKKIDELISFGDFRESFEMINDLIINHGDKEEFLFKKIEILEKLGFSKNKNKIISLLEDILSSDKNNIKAKELLIESYKRSDEKILLKKHATELLKIDPNNKIAKKYIKGKLWNMF